MQRDSTAKPDAAVLWVELAIAQNGLKKFDDAIVSAKKALETNAASKKPSPELEGAANNTLGEAFAGKNQIPDATAAYDAAAKAQPAQAGGGERDPQVSGCGGGGAAQLQDRAGLL